MHRQRKADDVIRLRTPTYDEVCVVRTPRFGREPAGANAGRRIGRIHVDPSHVQWDVKAENLTGADTERFDETRRGATTALVSRDHKPRWIARVA
jgi:hypothetical protein